MHTITISNCLPYQYDPLFPQDNQIDVLDEFRFFQREVNWRLFEDAMRKYYWTPIHIKTNQGVSVGGKLL